MVRGPQATRSHGCRSGIWVGLAFAVFSGVGCQYQTIRDARVTHRLADPEVSRADLAKLASDGLDGPHEILGWLELGAADQATGRLNATSRALLRAEAGFDQQDAKANTRITEKLFNSITSPLSAAYRGGSGHGADAPCDERDI